MPLRRSVTAPGRAARVGLPGLPARSHVCLWSLAGSRRAQRAGLVDGGVSRPGVDYAERRGARIR
jgi:hypothetical protein